MRVATDERPKRPFMKNPGGLAGRTGVDRIEIGTHCEAYTKLRSCFNDDGHFCGLEVVR